MLDGLQVAMGVSGSIAAVRCVELIHELQRHGAEVRVVMSEAATDIVHPNALEYASGTPVVTDLTGQVEHIELCGTDGWADVYLLAPATANTIGKVVAAIDDTPVTTCATTAIGAGVPLVVVPAMHEPMYDHVGVREHLEAVEARYGATVVPPRIEEDKAKIAADDDIVLAIARTATDVPLAGREVTILSGATAEPIDPVRELRTRASGKTGRALARACFARGASVTLIHDDTAPVPYAEVVPATSVDEVAAAAMDHADQSDVMIFAAAISDFTTAFRDEKIPSGEPLTVTFEPTEKVIETVRSAYPDLPIVGFKAETDGSTDGLLERARSLFKAHDCLFVVANDAAVMGADETAIYLVDSAEETAVSGSKHAVGEAIAERLADALRKTK